MAGSSSEGRTSRTRSVGTKISDEEYARLGAGQKLETYTYSWGSGGFASGLAGINIYFGGKLLQSKGVRLGSVRANFNGESMSYWPYGEERTNTANDREKFGTYMRDGVEQDYAMARYYNGSIGAFWTPDPGGIRTADPKNPLSWNRYAYTKGNPIGRFDPHGLEDCDPDEKDANGCDDPCDYDPFECQQGGGGGGGGGLTPNSPAGSNYTNKQMQLLTAGYNAAYQYLASAPCADMFASGADNAVNMAQGDLTNTIYAIVALPNGNTGAFTSSSNYVVINSTGAFFNFTTNSNNSVTVQLHNRKGKQQSLTFANAATFDAFLLLHELGHQVGLFGPDTAASVNGTYSGAVLDDCFTLTNGVYH